MCLLMLAMCLLVLVSMIHLWATHYAWCLFTCSKPSNLRGCPFKIACMTNWPYEHHTNQHHSNHVQVLSYIIKPGGYWVNLGPLLYHWAEGYGMVRHSAELVRSVTRTVLWYIMKCLRGFLFTMCEEDTTVNASLVRCSCRNLA
jgi:hypothetical protein